MSLSKIHLCDFTVFQDTKIELTEGINIFIGENGTGKTHIMKLLYSACQSVDLGVSFPHKVVKTFKPDDYKISRLVNRRPGNTKAKVEISSNKVNNSLSMEFSNKTKKWDAEVNNEEKWEKNLNELNSTFIPAKEILSNSYNIISAVEKNNVDFDDTYLDIIHSAKIDISAGKNTNQKNKHLEKINKIIGGKVVFDSKKDRFYLKQGNLNLEFNLVSEGIRKIALLWQLVKNGTLEKGAVLFWDEPEANINPQHIPLIVDMLLELEKQGVQIFIATHDYILSKYFDVKVQNEQKIVFHSLYKTEKGVKCESNKVFRNLDNNTIRDTFIQLYKDEVERDIN